MKAAVNRVASSQLSWKRNVLLLTSLPVELFAWKALSKRRRSLVDE